MNILVIWCCLVLIMVASVEFAFWFVDTIIYLFEKRRDKKMMEKYIENPVEMVNDKGEVFWVGYKK
jgi:hypothetical protein